MAEKCVGRPSLLWHECCDKVARLEAANERLAAALRQIDESSQGTLGEIGDCPDYKTAFRATEKCCGALQFIGDRARAALAHLGGT